MLRWVHLLKKNCFPLLQLNCSVTSLQKKFVIVNDEVKRAVTNKDPVVALESTIITHGMPYPHNLRTAENVERIIRENGALPATIGVIDGKIIVGLSKTEIEYLSSSTNGLLKISRRDLSHVLSKGLSGGTTVSSTMIAAYLAGIKIFVTGGIGGVHRDVFQSLDISSDLTELSQTPVTVVCAGIKSILDIKLTMEYLETQGVPVVTLGKSPYFPAFFTSASDVKAPIRLDSVEDLADMIWCQHVLNLRNGTVIGVPLPDRFSFAGNKIDEAIRNALEEARELNITGKEITPFVLERVTKHTDGASLQTNINLIENNAKVGSQLAKKLSTLMRNSSSTANFEMVRKDSRFKPKVLERIPAQPVVIGASVIDVTIRANFVHGNPEETNTGKLYQSFGGVGRNIAECLTRLGSKPLLISAVGDDEKGEMLLRNFKANKMDTSGILVSPHSTASYALTTNKRGEVLMAVGDMDINDVGRVSHIRKFEEQISVSPLVVIDSNFTMETINVVMEICRKHNRPLWIEPTCPSKSTKAFADIAPYATFVSPNLNELRAINDCLSKIELPNANDLVSECVTLGRACLRAVDNVFVTLGSNGVLVLRNAPFDAPFCFKGGKHSSGMLYPPAPSHLLPVYPKSVSGAGDSFVAGVVSAVLRNSSADLCIKTGLMAAYYSLDSFDAVSKKINMESHNSVKSWANFDAVKIF